MQYALIFFDLQLILAQMALHPHPLPERRTPVKLGALCRRSRGEKEQRRVGSVTYRSRFRDFEPTKLFIVQEFSDSRIGPAQRAIRIAADTDLAEPHGERIVHQQAANQGFSLLHDEFNRLCRLYHTNNPGQNSQDTRLTSRRHHTRRGWCGEQAAVAWADMRLKHTGLSFKLENAAMHHRLAREESSIVDQIARREIIAAVDD